VPVWQLSSSDQTTVIYNLELQLRSLPYWQLLRTFYRLVAASQPVQDAGDTTLQQDAGESGRRLRSDRDRPSTCIAWHQ
jgi:hypothetical protein